MKQVKRFKLPSLVVIFVCRLRTIGMRSKRNLWRQSLRGR